MGQSRVSCVLINQGNDRGLMPYLVSINHPICDWEINDGWREGDPNSLRGQLSAKSDIQMSVQLRPRR